MLQDKKLKAFVATTNADRARIFYKNILGLTLLSQDDFALEFDSNGTLLRVAFVNELVPQSFTVLGWNVPDIYSMIRLLNEKGIECNKYDFLEQDSYGIWKSPGGSKVAWIKDPDGNVLSFTEQ